MPMFLASLYYNDPQEGEIGLAHLDISTGDFLFTELDKELINELQRFRAAELIVDSYQAEKFVKSLPLRPYLQLLF